MPASSIATGDTSTVPATVAPSTLCVPLHELPPEWLPDKGSQEFIEKMHDFLDNEMQTAIKRSSFDAATTSSSAFERETNSQRNAPPSSRLIPPQRDLEVLCGRVKQYAALYHSLWPRGEPRSFESDADAASDLKTRLKASVFVGTDQEYTVMEAPGPRSTFSCSMLSLFNETMRSGQASIPFNQWDSWLAAEIKLAKEIIRSVGLNYAEAERTQRQQARFADFVKALAAVERLQRYRRPVIAAGDASRTPRAREALDKAVDALFELSPRMRVSFPSAFQTPAIVSPAPVSAVSAASVSSPPGDAGASSA